MRAAETLTPRRPNTSTASACDPNSHPPQREHCLETDAEHRNAAYVELDELKSSISGLLCHDLRGALCVLAGFLDMAQEEFGEHASESLQELLESSNLQLDRMTYILQELSDFSQMRDPKAEGTQRGPLDGVVEDILPATSLQYAQCGLRLEMDLQDDSPDCLVVVDHTSAILRSLLGVAGRMFKPPVVVKLSARIRDGFLELVVSGCGDGIAKDRDLELRNALTQDLAVRPIHADGLRLRLWVTGRATRALNGSFDTRFDKVAGPRFIVRLPLES